MFHPPRASQSKKQKKNTRLEKWDRKRQSVPDDLSCMHQTWDYPTKVFTWRTRPVTKILSLGGKKSESYRTANAMKCASVTNQIERSFPTKGNLYWRRWSTVALCACVVSKKNHQYLFDVSAISHGSLTVTFSSLSMERPHILNSLQPNLPLPPVEFAHFPLPHNLPIILSAFWARWLTSANHQLLPPLGRTDHSTWCPWFAKIASLPATAAGWKHGRKPLSSTGYAASKFNLKVFVCAVRCSPPPPFPPFRA